MTGETNTVDERQIHKATKDVIDRLADFDNETRRRVFRRALGFFELDIVPVPTPGRHVQSDRDRVPTPQGPANGGSPHFGDRTELPPKEFMFQKQPRTDIERIACLAYYLTHYRDTRQFKTIDLSKLNTEAAQIKFSNTAFAVVNATNAGLLVAADKGSKQLSAVGELYIEALPDRDKAKEVIANARIRRRRKSAKSSGESK
jgi:hypothetical protein